MLTLERKPLVEAQARLKRRVAMARRLQNSWRWYREMIVRVERVAYVLSFFPVWWVQAGARYLLHWLKTLRERQTGLAGVFLAGMEPYVRSCIDLYHSIEEREVTAPRINRLWRKWAREKGIMPKEAKLSVGPFTSAVLQDPVPRPRRRIPRQGEMAWKNEHSFPSKDDLVTWALSHPLLDRRRAHGRRGYHMC